MEYFIDENYLKDETVLTAIVDSENLSKYVKTAAIAYVRKIMGYKFFNDILDKFNDNTLDSDELELVEFIKPLVAHRAAYLAIPNLTFKITNKGPQSQFGEYSQSVGIDTVEFIRKDIISISRVYESDLKSFLKENYLKFPLWKSSENREIQGPDITPTSRRGGIRSI